MDLTNLGVQEMNAIESVNIDGGNPLWDWVVGEAIGAGADLLIWSFLNQPDGYINTHMP